MKNTKYKLVDTYLKTTDLTPNGVYKISPISYLNSYMEWLIENKHIQDVNKDNKKEKIS